MTDTITRKYTPTETDLVLADMLTENTGRHMLDSGGAYGRNWERNAGKTAEDFYNADPINLDFWAGDSVSITVDVFHWLSDRVEYARELDDQFHEFAKSMPDDSWTAVGDAFVEHLREVEFRDVAGLYGDGDPFWVNTYNGEDALSQVLQYLFLEIDDEQYALLQIHGGCDVRGGYTAPRAFHTNDEYMLFDNAKLTAITSYPDDKQEGGGLFPVESIDDIYWDSDDAGYSWHADGVWTGRDDQPDWEITEDKVIYRPWGTEVRFWGG